MTRQTSYVYLVSSLPPLVMTEPMPIPLETIMDTCRAYLSPEETQALESLNLATPPSSNYPLSIQRYLAWEVAVRNRLVFLRSYKLGVDADNYTHEEGKEVFLVDDTIHEIFNLPVFEKEKQLDLARWRVLDFMTASDRFNFACLCAYKIKCSLIQKWSLRELEHGKQNLEKLVQKVTEKVPSLAELSHQS